MKNYITLLFLLMTTLAFSQVGIYRTYSDFKAGRIQELKEYRGVNSIGRQVTAIHFRDLNNKKAKFKVKQEVMWGYRDGERVFRLNDKKNPCVLISVGKIVIFGNHTTEFTDYGIEYEYTDFAFYFSSKLNGKMIMLTKKKLLKTLVKGSEDYKSLKKSRKNLSSLLEWIQEYNAKYVK